MFSSVIFTEWELCLTVSFVTVQYGLCLAVSFIVVQYQYDLFPVVPFITCRVVV